MSEARPQSDRHGASALGQHRKAIGDGVLRAWGGGASRSNLAHAPVAGVAGRVGGGGGYVRLGACRSSFRPGCAARRVSEGGRLGARPSFGSSGALFCLFRQRMACFTGRRREASQRRPAQGSDPLMRWRSGDCCFAPPPPPRTISPRLVSICGRGIREFLLRHPIVLRKGCTALRSTCGATPPATPSSPPAPRRLGGTSVVAGDPGPV